MPQWVGNLTSNSANSIKGFYCLKEREAFLYFNGCRRFHENPRLSSASAVYGTHPKQPAFPFRLASKALQAPPADRETLWAICAQTVAQSRIQPPLKSSHSGEARDSKRSKKRKLELRSVSDERGKGDAVRQTR